MSVDRVVGGLVPEGNSGLWSFAHSVFSQPWLHAGVSRRAKFICAPAASHDHADERAADPLHRARVNAKTLGDPTYTFTSALTLIQGCLDSLLKLGLPSSLARLSPARTRSAIIARSNSVNTPII
jgi:hypothetical protein